VLAIGFVQRRAEGVAEGRVGEDRAQRVMVFGRRPGRHRLEDVGAIEGKGQAERLARTLGVDRYAARAGRRCRLDDANRPVGLVREMKQRRIEAGPAADPAHFLHEGDGVMFAAGGHEDAVVELGHHFCKGPEFRVRGQPGRDRNTAGAAMIFVRR